MLPAISCSGVDFTQRPPLHPNSHCCDNNNMPESRVEHHLLTKVGEGRSAEVYAYGTDRVVKLFWNQIAQAVVETELRNSRLVYSLGLPVPEAIGLVRVGGRLGIAFERCDGPTMLDAALRNRSEIETVAENFFVLQRQIHGSNAVSLPPAKPGIERKIRSARGVGIDAKRKALAALDTLPDESALCHGDFHPRNVVLTANGARVIDWLDAGTADPAFDVARSLLLIEHAAPADVDTTLRQSFRDSYLRHWQREWPDALQRLEQWRYPLAVARLAESVSDSARLLLRQYVERTAAEHA